MGFVDILLMVVIIAGAVYLLYRSLWKKKGHCQGCDLGYCDNKKIRTKLIKDKDPEIGRQGYGDYKIHC